MMNTASAADRIAVLCRVMDVDPQLAHALRIAAHRQRFTAEQASRVIALLGRLPRRAQ